MIFKYIFQPNYLSYRGVARWLKKKPPGPNNRTSLRHRRFKIGLDPEKIIEQYSRDEIPNPYEGERTFKDAQRSIGRKDLLLPNIRQEDLELNAIFQQELDRQRAIIARIEKIRVVIDSIPGKDTVLMMNKGISTPYDCAGHIHQLVTDRSVLAQIDYDDQKTTYWDMHRPLEEDCRIKFRHFLEKDVSFLNKSYWRSCTFVMGMAIRLAFKEQVKPILHSWPKPDIHSGSFVYDVALNLSDKWSPTEQELRAFTKILWNIKKANLPFERIEVDKETALKMFTTNPFKQTQIQSMEDDRKITIYRCGGLLDMSVGPMISNTSQIGRITLASVHPFESETPEYKGIFYRFQGVSVPQQLPVSSYLYQNLLINRARTLNRTSL